MGCCGSKPKEAPDSADSATLGGSAGFDDGRPDSPGVTEGTATGASVGDEGKGTKRVQKRSSIAMATPSFAPAHFDITYLGRVTTTTYEGDDTIIAAKKRLKKEFSGKPIDAKMMVSADHVVVTAVKGGAVLNDCVISEVTYSSVNASNKKAFAFITLDKNQMGFCHFVTVKGHAAAIHTAVKSAYHAAQVVARRDKTEVSGNTAAYARSMTQSDLSIRNGDSTFSTKDKAADNGDEEYTPHPRNAVQKGRDASEILGTFEVTYLGALPCKESRGAHVVQATAQRMFDAGKMSDTKCALIITGGGLKAVDTVTSQAVSVANIVSVSFTAAVSDKPLVKQVRSVVPSCSILFGYIVKDEALNRVTCAVFACSKADVATQLALAIQKAFEVQKEIQKLRRKNPFAAISSKREASPKSLFRLQIHRADLSAIKVIGFGQFGEVYMAKHVLKIQNPAPGAPKTTSKVRAVKILRGNANTADRTEFLREAEVMVALKHPNLVELIGVSVQQRPWLTALEFLQYGDMLKVMTTCAEKNIELSEYEFYNVFAQMAAGMDYIAGLRMIHMDLAARNVLLGSQNVCKIADFGLTRKLQPGKDYYRLMKTMKLPIKWLAYESIVHKVFTVKTDVWAFGIMMWEILSYSQIPYGDAKNLEIRDLVESGERPVKPDACTEPFYRFMKSLWYKDPITRPDFRGVCTRLLEFREAAQQRCPPLRDIGATLHGDENAGTVEPAEVVLSTPPPLSEQEQVLARQQGSGSDPVDGDDDDGSGPAAKGYLKVGNTHDDNSSDNDDGDNNEEHVDSKGDTDAMDGANCDDDDGNNDANDGDSDVNDGDNAVNDGDNDVNDGENDVLMSSNDTTMPLHHHAENPAFQSNVEAPSEDNSDDSDDDVDLDAEISRPQPGVTLTPAADASEDDSDGSDLDC